jgi:V-type H+-transporting ATPase subunit E
LLFFSSQLLENQVGIRCRDVDKPIVERLVNGACAEYKQKTGKEVVIKVDPDNSLPANGYVGNASTYSYVKLPLIFSCGGIILFAQRGRIKIVNTLEARLELIAQQFVPEIRVAIFGRNPNRKFSD